MVFNEKQNINGLGFKLLYGVSTLSVLSIVLFSESQVEEANFSYWFFVVGLAVFLGAIYLLVFETSAFTKIDRNGISYKYRPFIWNFRCIAWSEIKSAEVIPISPLKDFGGWGYRFGPRKGRAIVMSSDFAIVIIKKTGKRFSITTGRKQELERVVGFWLNEFKQND